MKSPVLRNLPDKATRHKLFGSVDPGPRTKPTIKSDMADIQSSKKDFLFSIKQVGISNVKYPIVVESAIKPTIQQTIGTFKLSSAIGQDSKGTNMSRFLEQIEASKADGFRVTLTDLKAFGLALRDRLEQEKVSVEVAFPWFFEKIGPESGLGGLNHGDVSISLEQQANGETKYAATLAVSITTLCPCSKEISEYSAHSQRGKVTMEVTFADGFEYEEPDWKKDLLHAAESNASAPIHPVLKRVDEKYVTETAYENPRFVEDMVRLVAADLYELDYVDKFTVTCENEESIHLHNAIAVIEYDKADERM